MLTIFRGRIRHPGGYHRIPIIRSNGRMAKPVATWYDQRSRIETQMGPLEERHRPHAQSSQLLQADHRDHTRLARVRMRLLTLQLGKGRISSPPPIRATTLRDTSVVRVRD